MFENHKIHSLPRTRLINGFTAIERLERLERHFHAELRGGRLFVKRDDVMGLGGGGNKLRKLEFLLADAQNQGVDTILTVGGRQSNHARLTAAVAARFGLDCELFLTQVVPRHGDSYQFNGNIVLDAIFGAVVHDLPGTANALDLAQKRAEELKTQGRKAYIAPTGGSSAIGCLGYAACAYEIEAQAEDLGLRIERVVVPNGSSGMHAGLAAGFAAQGKSAGLVKSFAVLGSEDATRVATIAKARDVLSNLDVAAVIADEDIVVTGSERGEGYGIPTPSMIEAVHLMARTEGLLLDPVYSGKAFAGLIADIRAGAVAGGDVLFIMSGGTPALYAYDEVFVPGSMRH